MRAKFHVISTCFLSLVMCLSLISTAFAVETENVVLQDGVNIFKEGAEGKVYNIDDNKIVMIEGTDSDPIMFKNCTFNMSGATIKLSGNQEGVSYNNGETITKLFIGKNVQFDNCQFISESGQKISKAGYDACIYFFSGEIVLNECTVQAKNYQGQFLGLYGTSGSVTFNNSNISTVGNTGGWSYAMYGASVLNLNLSTMTATGMKREVNSGNVNAFYSGDLRTNYDAINIKDSTINFSDNFGGGFAINNVNIHVDDSQIIVNNNAGNASNSGVWYVHDSIIQMNGNKTHGWSHISDHVTDSEIEILHNGYAGYYITADSDMTNSVINIRCNGEKYLSYSAGDVWINGHILAFKDCKSVWLGAVGRKGMITTENCPYVVAYDLYENKTKGNTAPVLDGVTLSEQDEHVLFLNPSKDFDYARGDTEGKTGNSNDDDLFEDVSKEVVTNKDTAKIKTLTTAQLSHHKYDWDNGEITDQATEDSFGVVRYECIDVCTSYKNWTETHENSFDCEGTYVYAPLVGLTFDVNTEEKVMNVPATQDEIHYESTAKEPTEIPTREGYDFGGWYVDKECTKLYDFDTKLTDNWTIVYAKWIQKTTYTVEHHYYTVTTDGQEIFDGVAQDKTTISEAHVGDIIETSTLERYLELNGVQYSADIDERYIILSADSSKNVIVIQYHRAQPEEKPLPVEPTQPQEPTVPSTPDEIIDPEPSVDQPVVSTPVENTQPNTGDTYYIGYCVLAMCISGMGILMINKKHQYKNK